MTIKPRFLAALVAFFVCIGQSFAAVIIAPGSSWDYSFDHGATWLNGPAPFGNNQYGDFGYDQGTYWPEYAALTVKKSIDLSGFDLNSIKWSLGVDNGYNLLVNNKSVSAANHEGYTFRWEYTGVIAKTDLLAGINELVIELEDHGGATAFDFELTGAACQHQVADAAQSFGLLLGSLALMVGLRRRLR